MQEKTVQCIEIVKDKLIFKKVEAFLITNSVNVKYLTSFTGSYGMVFFNGKDQYFITDSRYILQARKEISNYKIIRQEDPLPETIKSLLDSTEIKCLGIEEEKLSYKNCKLLKEKLKGISLVDLEKIIEEIRLKKNEEEIRRIKKACREIQLAINEVLKFIKEDVLEVEIAAEIEYFLKKRGTGVAFDIIVASGVRSSFPHALASNRKIKNNDLLLIDAGACVEGYHSDITRTIILGNISKKKKEIYDVVKDAQEYALSIIKVGVRCNELDKKVREYIESRGYGKYFVHNLGHGVGLEVHEEPTIGIRTKDEVILEEGMVVTVEPGVYIPNLGGVRMENMVLVKEKGCEVLTKKLPLEIRL
ncbi:MAG: Xaa-Pro peptidase family protein [bacterium]|nr:Xaa-Pro peptidase family protein [bacterium]